MLGPSEIERDKLARVVAYWGDWNAEWAAYGPDVKAIATAFTDGINAYIKGLGGKWPVEFQIAGYAPGMWVPADCLSRIAGLLMIHNLTSEVSHAEDIQRLGLEAARKLIRLDPPIRLDVPQGLDPADITNDVLRTYREAIGPVRLTDQGSNNWVVDGTMTATGRPMLANDPHRPVQLPSLRKTVHLVGPGWDAIGSGEPGLPGIALGHNRNIAFGFTIAAIDQEDLYVETVNPANPGEYRYRGAWKKFETREERLAVKGRGVETITLRYTVHGPVIHEDAARHRAYALRWVGNGAGNGGLHGGAEPGARHTTGTSFREAMSRYRVPAENLVYADTQGNIGWQVGGLTPIREGWSGLLPVPGAEGALRMEGLPQVRRDAVRIQSAAPLHRHRQPQHPAAGIPVSAGIRRLGAAVPGGAHPRDAGAPGDARQETRYRRFRAHAAGRHLASRAALAAGAEGVAPGGGLARGLGGEGDSGLGRGGAGGLAGGADLRSVDVEAAGRGVSGARRRARLAARHGDAAPHAGNATRGAGARENRSTRRSIRSPASSAAAPGIGNGASCTS